MRLKNKTISCILLLIILLITCPLISIKVKAANNLDDFVTRCYSVALQREPDTEGFNYWKKRISSNELTGTSVVYSFIFSTEYTSQNKTDEDFVNDLYTMFMGRPADQEGYEYWKSNIQNGKTREEVFAGFANSVEFYDLCCDYGITAGYFTNDYSFAQVNNVNLFVERLYKTCLGRLGDQGGQKYWVEGMLKGELTGIDCASKYIKSSEYENLGLSNEQYVENLYIAFMGRTYDEGGKANWLNQLNDGTLSRDQVFEGFANSAEFKSICKGYGIECGSYIATDKNDTFIITLDNITHIYVNGKVVKCIVYDASGNISEILLFDKNGNVVNHTYYDASGNITDKTEFEYYPNNDRKTETVYKGTKKIRFIEYYEKQKTKKVIEYDSQENIISICEYEESTGSEIKTTYDSAGQIICVIYSEYYENSHIKKISKYVGSNVLDCVYEYYENGNTKYIITYYNNGVIKSMNEYYENGNSKSFITYNTSGKIISQLNYDINGHLLH